MRIITRMGTGMYGETISRLIGEVCAALSRGNRPAPAFSVAGPIMTVYHDNEYREQDGDVEVGLPVAGRVEDPATELRALPAARVVSPVYTG